MTKPHTVKDIFDQAVEFESREEQQAYLNEACAGETEVRREVESLLKALDRAGDFLGTQPVFDGGRDTPNLADATIALTPNPDAVPPQQLELPDYLQASTRPGSLGRLGHYEILDVIGRGGMSLVLKGFDEKL